MLISASAQHGVNRSEFTFFMKEQQIYKIYKATVFKTAHQATKDNDPRDTGNKMSCMSALA